MKKHLIGFGIAAGLVGSLALAPVVSAKGHGGTRTMGMQCPAVPAGGVAVTVDRTNDGATIHLSARGGADVTELQRKANEIAHCIGGAPMPSAAPAKPTSP